MDTNSQTPLSQDSRHAIAVASRRTGLSQLVLRAWERRYGAVVPARTDTGRRLYSDADLVRLTLLKTLTSAGHRIGDVANLPLDDLRTLAGELPPSDPDPATPPVRPAQTTALLDQALTAIGDLNADRLGIVLDDALLSLSKPLLRNEFIVPLLDAIGERWHDGALRVAHEHMASAVLTTFLSDLNSRHAPPAGAPVLVVATPSRQVHELGALLAASQALDLGWDVLYLGVDLPAEEIASGVRIRNARALYLNLIYPLADATVEAQLRAVRRLVGPGLPIVVTGRATESYAGVLSEIGARIAADPAEFTQALGEISP